MPIQKRNRNKLKQEFLETELELPLKTFLVEK
jgi:hypothetical protein